ncbi:MULTISPECIES: putative nitrogen fixation protein NifT [Shewanella]|uniref:Nitrogen fixation protein NifT n=2 Tax=Shewanella TaxID=22 RepID=A0ABX8DCG4_9GAMM|nr:MULTISPECIES: putative nitrogen fixation protein NifT [Shewanella]MCL1074746.1 putative nitrogen fixation protein NifT [Shewanella dokdonensis]MDF0535857.1 putative nitrogen fixation protein NifT [Shewanella sp. A32]QUN05347.1 putative nitrogen fixation protein NifT [Shewanella yunxiaonensis]QVK22273.1 putative nitrogen fixation protein NifT [Shewanella dokdonensis]
MANVMIQYNEQGALCLYLPKKDLEEAITHFEFDTAEQWGGEVHLAGGAIYYIDPIPAPERLPITVRAKRLQAA